MNAPADSLRRAGALIAQGRLDDARSLLHQCLEEFPEQSEGHQLLAMIETREGRLEAAVGHAEAYLRGRPDDAAGWYNLGYVRQQQQQWQAALTAYRRARELDREHLPTAVNLAEVLDRCGDSTGAIEMLQEVLAGTPGQASAANTLAAIQLREGRAAAAQAVLRTALENNPMDPVSWMNLGIAQARAGDAHEAIAAYRRALALRPDFAAARLNLAKALARRGEPHSALAEIDEALSRRPGQGDYHSARSVILDQLGRGDEALDAARSATQLAPKDANAWYNLASLKSRRTDTADLSNAADAARACLQLQPAHAAAHQCLAIVLAKQGRMPAALEHAGRACALDAGAEYAVTHADLLADAGRLPEALAVLAETSRAHPEAVKAQRQRGIVLLKMEQPRAALVALDRALELDPTDQRAIAHRAVALQRLGRDAEASAFLGLDRHIYEVTLTPPEGFSDLEAFNRQLARDIRNHSRLRWEPIGLAARNGGLTDDLTADRTPAILGFVQSLRRAIDDLRSGLAESPDDPFLSRLPRPDYRLNLWATLVEEGGNIDTHIHEESWLSGAYYVELPESLGSAAENPAGWIEFGRPHQGMPFSPPSETRLYRPRPGLLLLFPSYLFHRTIPHPGGQQRISISFDLSG